MYKLSLGKYQRIPLETEMSGIYDELMTRISQYIYTMLRDCII